MFFCLACLVVQQCNQLDLALFFLTFGSCSLLVCRFVTLIFRYCRFAPRTPCIAVDLDCSLFGGGGSSKMNIEMNRNDEALKLKVICLDISFSPVHILFDLIQTQFNDHSLFRAPVIG